MSSKIAKEIEQAIGRWNDDRLLEQVIDDVIGDRTIPRREVNQLRKDIESLKSTLEVVHVNLARAENEADSNGLLLDLVKNLNENNAQDAQFWHNEAIQYGCIMGTLTNKLYLAKESLWNTEKELNDLKKSLDVPPAQAAELQWNGLPKFDARNVTLSSIAAMSANDYALFISDPVNRKAVDDLFSGKESSKKSGGSVWVVLAVAGAILTGGIVLIYHLANL